MTTHRPVDDSGATSVRNANVPVRRFETLKEIQELPRFEAESPVTEQNYSHLLGWYDFHGDLIVSCCHQSEVKSLCLKKHGYGFVTVAKDGTESVIGNCCAEKYFDVDTNLRRDIKLANNERERLKRLESVRELISRKDTRLSQIKKLADQLAAAEIQFGDYCKHLGSSMQAHLIKLYKSERPSITITTVHKRVGVDDDGHEDIEVTRLERVVGNVRGLRVFDTQQRRTLRQKRLELDETYDQLDSVDDDIRRSELTALQNKLGVFDEIVAMHNELLREFKTFMTNDLQSFLYLTQDISERKNLAKHILEQRGQQHGSDKAKEYIRDLDQSIKDDFKADKLELYN